MSYARIENPMTKEQRAIWVKALRSGEYTQGRTGRLRKKDRATVRYCCLGVARDLFPNIQSFRPTEQILKDTRHTYHFLPRDVQGTLADMNDGGSNGPKSFSEIADYIETSVRAYDE